MQRINIFCGIFEDEIGQRFLRSVIMLLHTSLQELWDKRESDFTYELSLKKVCVWGQPLVKSEVDKVLIAFPDMNLLLMDLFVSYCSRIKPERRTKIAIFPPRLELFCHRFLIFVSSQPSIVSGSLFKSQDTLSKRIVCMDCARDALNTFATNPQHMHAILSTGISNELRDATAITNVSQHAPIRVETHIKTVDNDSTPVLPDQTSNEYRGCTEDANAMSDLSSEDGIFPSDSVSNVSYRNNGLIEVDVDDAAGNT